MKVVFRFVLVVFCFISVLAENTFGAGVLGKGHVYVGAGAVKPGEKEIEDVVGMVVKVEAGINVPLNDQVDVFVSVDHKKADGEDQSVKVDMTQTDFRGGLFYKLKPEEDVCPFVILGVGRVTDEMDITTAGVLNKRSTDDYSWEVGVGAELILSETMGLTPIALYEKVDDEDDFVISVDLDVWLNDTVFGVIGSFYSVDSEDISIYGRMGFTF